MYVVIKSSAFSRRSVSSTNAFAQLHRAVHVSRTKLTCSLASFTIVSLYAFICSSTPDAAATSVSATLISASKICLEAESNNSETFRGVASFKSNACPSDSRRFYYYRYLRLNTSSRTLQTPGTLFRRTRSCSRLLSSIATRFSPPLV